MRSEATPSKVPITRSRTYFSGNLMKMGLPKWLAPSSSGLIAFYSAMVYPIREANVIRCDDRMMVARAAQAAEARTVGSTLANILVEIDVVAVRT